MVGDLIGVRCLIYKWRFARYRSKARLLTDLIRQPPWNKALESAENSTKRRRLMVAKVPPPRNR